MIDSKIFIYPLCVGVMLSPIFYFLINRISGGLFIIFFGVMFFFAFWAEGLILGLKNNLLFSLLSTVALIISYFLSLLVGVVTVNQLLSIVVGNILMAICLFALDGYLYGLRGSSAFIYLAASCASITVLYFISIYSDKDGLGAIYSLCYPSIIYCYLQGFVINHFLFSKGSP